MSHDPRPSTILVTTHHDPDGRMDDLIAPHFPALIGIVGAVAVQITETSAIGSALQLIALGADVRAGPADSYALLGRSRRAALELALQDEAETIVFGDLDRMLHWAAFHPAELRRVVRNGLIGDCCVLGRTRAAFASHPRCQRDTEAIINTVFAHASGKTWDICAAARLLSRRAAEELLANCSEESIGTDGAWPLHLLRCGFDVRYLATRGLEFETADRFPVEVAAAGGRAGWVDALDADPREWERRLEVARIEVAAITT